MSIKGHSKEFRFPPGVTEAIWGLEWHDLFSVALVYGEFGGGRGTGDGKDLLLGKSGGLGRVGAPG